jgi:hypothetical protein
MAINSITGNTMLASGSFPPVRAASTGSPLDPEAGGLLVVDGVQLAAGDRVLCKDETSAVNNGIYAANAGPWVRTTDASGNTQFFSGMAVTVALGAVNAGQTFICTCMDDPVVVGTSLITWASQQAAATATQQATSTTSLTVGVGSNTLTIPAGKAFQAGQWVLIQETSNGANQMLGQITAYSGASLTVNVTATGGSGTHADWTIVLTNSAAAAGYQPPVGSGNVTGPGSSVAGHVATFADGTGKVLADGGAPWVSITTFGGRGDGTTDNTTPFLNALASLSGQGGGIFFPAGKYKFNAGITSNLPAGVFSVIISGAGQDATELTWPNASGGIAFNYADASTSVHIRDLTLTTGTTSGGSAITLALSTGLSNPAVTAISNLYRVTMRGSDGYAATNYWTNGLSIQNVSNVQADSLAIFGGSTPSGNGINLIGNVSSAQYGVQYNIAKSTFENLAQGIVYGSYIQGVTVDQCNFTGCVQGIISPASQGGVLAQLAVTNSQFNPPANGNGILTQTWITETQISNCLFILLQNNGTAVNLAANNHFTISGNEITASVSATGTTGVAIGTTTSGGTGTITGNDFFGFDTGILLQSGSSGVSIQGNTINNAAGHGNTLISNFSSSITNVIVNNPGYNPVGASGISVGASPFVYTAGASAETIYIWGGVVSSITFDRNGGALGVVASASSPCTVELGPWEQVKVTYSSIPNMNKMVH